MRLKFYSQFFNSALQYIIVTNVKECRFSHFQHATINTITAAR